jgi:hypothetical protein
MEYDASDRFNPENLRAPVDSIPVTPPRRAVTRRPRKHIDGRFYPAIPEPWLLKARTLPGKAPLDVAIVLRQQAALRKSLTVRLSNKPFLPLGSSGRFHKIRGLRALEAAGLVSVEWRTGASPIVTILEMGNDTTSKTIGEEPS